MSPEKMVRSDFSHIADSTLEPDSKAFLQTDTIFKSINVVIKCLSVGTLFNHFGFFVFNWIVKLQIWER
jgi:hypothetical protein